MYTLIKNIRSEEGFTLLEIIVALFVVSIIITSVTPFIQVQVDSYIKGLNAKFALETVRVGMERAMSEIRYAQAASSTYINTASSTEFDFYNETGERIEISYGTFTANGNSSTCLLFRVGSSTTAMPLIYNVSACTFTYLDSAGSSTSTKANIRIVRLDITVKDTDTGTTFSILNQVAPQNFRS